MNEIEYIYENNLIGDALKLANKVGNIYVAARMIYRGMPQTSQNIEIARQATEAYKRHDEEVFQDHLSMFDK